MYGKRRGNLLAFGLGGLAWLLLSWGLAAPPCAAQGGFLGQGLTRIGGYALRSSCQDEDLVSVLPRLADEIEESLDKSLGLTVTRVESWDVENLAGSSSVKLVLKALLQRMGEWGWVPVSQDVEENQGFRTHTYLFLHQRGGAPLFVLVGEYPRWLSVQVFWLRSREAPPPLPSSREF